MPEPGADLRPTDVAEETEGLDAFQYAILRVVPRVERGERINVGVVLFCRSRDFLAVRIELDEQRLRALDPQLDFEAVRRHAEFIRRVAEGDPSCGAPGRLAAAERFGWLVAPSNTVVQPSEVHIGLCEDPEAMLEKLVARLVRPV